MKKIIAVISALTTIAACNSSTEKAEKTSANTDSLQVLLNSIRDSIIKYPDDLRLKYNLAVVLQDMGKYKEALAALDAAAITQPDPDDPAVFYNYAYKKSELQELSADTAAAIKTLEVLVKPGEISEASLRLANLYAETGNSKVIGICNAMEKTDTLQDVAEINYFRGIYFSNTGEYGKAINEFDRSIQKSYTFLNAYLEKGIALYKLKDYQKAIAAFDLAITVSNTFADAFYWKGKCQEALGEKEEAKLNYRRAYGLDKTFIEAKEAAERSQRHD